MRYMPLLITDIPLIYLGLISIEELNGGILENPLSLMVDKMNPHNRFGITDSPCMLNIHGGGILWRRCINFLLSYSYTST